MIHLWPEGWCCGQKGLGVIQGAEFCLRLLSAFSKTKALQFPPQSPFSWTRRVVPPEQSEAGHKRASPIKIIQDISLGLGIEGSGFRPTWFFMYTHLCHTSKQFFCSPPFPINLFTVRIFFLTGTLEYWLSLFLQTAFTWSKCLLYPSPRGRAAIRALYFILCLCAPRPWANESLTVWEPKGLLDFRPSRLHSFGDTSGSQIAILY